MEPIGASTGNITGPNFDIESKYVRASIEYVMGASVMNQTLRLAVAATVVTFIGFSAGALAQVAETQIQLTEKQIEGFIAAQADMSAMVAKTQGAIFSGDAKYKAEVSTVTKKHGFKNFAEYQMVAANISMVIAAIDPQTKVFTDPQAAIKKEIGDVNSDKTVPSSEKKKLLAELNEALNSTQSIEFPNNIELVKRYYDKIDVTDFAAYDSSSHSSVVRTIRE